jgi:hypothetical protein
VIDVRFRQIWFNAVLACKELPAPVRLVAQAIGHVMNVGTGQCNPSYETLGERTGQSARTCMRAVKALEAAGWIAVVRTKGRHSNNFVLKMPASAAVGVDLATELPLQTEAAEARAVMVAETNRDKALSPFTPAQPCQSSVTVPVSQPCHSSVTDAKEQQCQIEPSTVTELCHPNNKNKYIPLKPPTQTGNDIDSTFEELWEIWANNTDKGKARQAFHRAVTGLRVDPSTIIEAARDRRIGRRLSGDVPEAVPLARWLRGEGWSAETKPASSGELKASEAKRPDVFVEEGTAAWKAWKEHRRRQGKGVQSAIAFPSERGRRGWHFETEWPTTSREVQHG